MAFKVTSGDESLKVELEGRGKLTRTLRKASEDLEDLKEANARAAKIVEEGALGLVPVQSGFLASTIRSSGTKRAGVVRVGGRNAPYAGPIHWGWPARKIPANPFAASAAKLTEPTWAQIYNDAVQKALARIKGA